MNLEMLGDRVLIEQEKGEEKTKSGIIIPDTAKEKPQKGTVVSVGPGKRDDSGKLIPMELKAGDKVLYGKYAGTEVKLDGKDYVYMDQGDVIAKVKEKVK
ncbi:MAG: co-chaperone GroES [Candidatus Omnitrophota bacterium]|nr:co-chaperone GroES [Candidatus Omnitrophota bacterium]MBU2528960.1 co-chaperone GroES [bacterium]MBU3930170.1 co-chaperone GroES [bacterium]MBU4122535.1 co-chaperone GroES [bacterium]